MRCGTQAFNSAVFECVSFDDVMQCSLDDRDAKSVFWVLKKMHSDSSVLVCVDVASVARDSVS